MVDFQWHPEDPFTMMSLSEEEAGGTMQLWRICDLVTKPEKDSLAELDQHRHALPPPLPLVHILGPLRAHPCS